MAFLFVFLALFAPVKAVPPGPQKKFRERILLDLTEPAPQDAQSMGVPGIAVGGVVGGLTFPPKYDLPLAVTIQSVKPETVRWNQDFTIEVIVRNKGTAPFYLPQFRNPRKVHAEGQKGRRTLLFLVRFDLPEEGEHTRNVVASTNSTETVPESVLELAPQQTVRVLLPADLGAIRDRLPSKTREVRFRVILHEWTLEDDRYFIKSLSQDAESENKATVSLRK